MRPWSISRRADRLRLAGHRGRGADGAHVPGEGTIGRGENVAPPGASLPLAALTAFEEGGSPSAPISSATASAPGMTWMAGWPASKPIALVHLEGHAPSRGLVESVARSESALSPWRPGYTGPWGDRTRRPCGTGAHLGQRVPATMAPMVSRRTSSDAATWTREAAFSSVS